MIPSTDARGILARPITALAALLLAAFVTLIVLDRPLIRGDGVAYLAWVDTLVLDRDVDFNNQFERFEPVNSYQITWNNTTQRWVNIFPFGVAFVQAPFYLVGDGLYRADVLNRNPDYFRQMQGVELPYSLLLMLGANLMALVTLALTWDIGRRFVSPWLAALIVYAVFMGTPLVFYSAVEPLNSHNPGALMIAVFFYILARCSYGLGERWGDSREAIDHRSAWWWIGLGVSAGLAVLVRWQLAAALAPAAIILIAERRWRGIGIAGIAGVITLLPLPLIWSALFGAPFVIPYNEVTGEAFMQSASNEFVNVLRVLLNTSPVLLLIFPGWIALGRISWKWALMLAIIFFGQVYVNGAALDWNAGYSFGVRRMTELFTLYCLPICALFGWLVSAVQRPLAQRWMRVGLSLASLVVIVFAWVYLLSFFSYIWTSVEGWLGDTTPQSTITYFVEQPNRVEVVQTIFTTHLGPNAWSQPGP